jgi:antitoxin (DNA-binding transcriptional repressor) of toxin-antitoxin stability system
MVPGGQAATSSFLACAVDREPYRPYTSPMGKRKSNSTGAELARQELPAILDAAERGTATVVTRRGRAIAAVVPLHVLEEHRKDRVTRPASLLAVAGTGKGLWGPDVAATIAGLREEWSR